jgi:uncharacterized MAPEG superfamily protein
MPHDLTLLVCAAALTLIQALIAAFGVTSQVGLPAAIGNRDTLPPITGWAGRAARAHRNMLESFVIFTALVLVAQVAGRANATTALGSDLFLWARVIYVPVYLIGIPWVRSGVWTVSVIGLVLIFTQLT